MMTWCLLVMKAAVLPPDTLKELPVHLGPDVSRWGVGGGIKGCSYDCP